LALALGALTLSCNAVLGIGEPETDVGLTQADWPTKSGPGVGPTKWVPVHYTLRSETNEPDGPERRFSTNQKAQLLSQLPAEMDACVPCPDDPRGGFLLRIFSGGAFADRLQTCDALINCMQAQLEGKSTAEAPQRDILVKIVPR